MSSNNPFASAMSGEYKHYREPPPPPPAAEHRLASPRREKKAAAPPPPAYEVATGRTSKEYPAEKPAASSSSAARPHRSHSDSTRHRERKESSRRHKSSSLRNKSPSKKKAPPVLPKNLDTIDKLDVSAFFGGRFHHDGPFDACTPHRNKNSKAAPVMAFPADGPNTLMKAFGQPVNADSRMNLAFGNYAEDQNEIVGRAAKDTQPPVTKTNRDTHDPQSTMYTPRLNPSVIAFDANEKSAPIHGPATAGLGSSTFLDGAPAPKCDDYLTPPQMGGGIGRKKSLVQRLRKNSQSENSSRRSSHDNSGEYSRASFGEEEGGTSLLLRVKSLKVGRK